MQHEKRIGHMQQRRNAGLTHREIAEEYGLSRQHIGRLLRGNLAKNPVSYEYGETEPAKDYLERDL